MTVANLDGPILRPRSGEHAVHEPLRGGIDVAVETVAVEPEATAACVLHDIVVARPLTRPAPPLGRDALGALRLDHLMQRAAPAEMPRRAVGHHCQHLGPLGVLQHEQRAGGRGGSLSPLFSGERAGLRGGGKLLTSSMWPPLTPTLSPQAGRGGRAPPLAL